MPKSNPPFTEEQVELLNKFQHSGKFHSFTCDGKPYIINKLQPGMDRSKKLCPKSGVLIATIDGFVCPCGTYTQDWAHDFMLEK